MKWIFLIFALPVMFLILSCKQDPLPKTGELLNDPPKQPDPILPPLVLTLPAMYDFEEGALKEFVIQATVPEPGLPIVRVANLPPEAKFNSETMTLSWTPPYDSGNDAGNPTVSQRLYQVTFILNSSENSVNSISRTTILQVRDKPREPKVVIAQADQYMTSFLRETEKFVEDIEIFSEDYPQGPFTVRIPNLPPDASLIVDHLNPAKWRVTYTPDFKSCTDGNYDYTSENDQNYHSIKEINLQVISPNGRQTNVKTTWDIVDFRQFAEVSAPSELTQGTEVNFVMRAEDPNGELPPWLIVVETPNFGKISVDTEQGDGNPRWRINPSTIVKVRWVQIPPEKIGTSYDLKFNICVNDTWYHGYKKCKAQEVKIHFKGEIHSPPTVDRTKWPLGYVQFLREKSNLVISVPVRGEYGKCVPPCKVEIYPEQIRPEVGWKNNILTLSPERTGIYQFDLVATSEYGVIQKESFMFEALPWSWSSVLILGDDPGSVEMSKTLELFDEANIANPYLQELDGKLMALRTTLVIGTHVLNDKTVIADIEKFSDRFKNIVLLSPLLENLKGEIGEEMKKFGISFLGRFIELPINPKPPLSEFEVRSGGEGGLSGSTKPVGLNEKTTSESNSPMIFSDLSLRSCKPVLWLSHAKLEGALLSALMCDRGQGGTLLVSGFEWADLATSSSDKTIGKRWMSQMVKP